MDKEKAKETFELCQQKIKEHDLNMFLIDCEYTFDYFLPSPCGQIRA